MTKAKMEMRDDGDGGDEDEDTYLEAAKRTSNECRRSHSYSGYLQLTVIVSNSYVWQAGEAEHRKKPSGVAMATRRPGTCLTFYGAQTTTASTRAGSFHSIESMAPNSETPATERWRGHPKMVNVAPLERANKTDRYR